MRKCYAGVILLLVAVLVGCGVSESDITGEVTLDGKPLKEGEIVFEAADGKVAPVAAPIQDGTFALRVPTGSKVVRINAAGPSDKIDPVLKTPFRESIIPEVYNSDTKLTANVEAGKANKFTFTLKSKP